MTQFKVIVIDPEGFETIHPGVVQRPLVREGCVWFVEAVEPGRVVEWCVPLAAVRAVAWETSIEGGGG